MSEQYVKHVFDTYWSEANPKIKSWNYLSQTIYEILKGELGTFSGKKIAEIGSGSGRISARLASEGAEVTAFDISSEALKISKQMFTRMALKGTHIKGSMFEIGIRPERYDVVWNAGVLEHFSKTEQACALKEMARICKADGCVITLHPYAESVLYRMGKKALERLGKWEYGKLEPIKSMKDLAMDSGLHLVKEYPDDFFIQIIEGPRRFIPRLGPWFSDGIGYAMIRARNRVMFPLQVAMDRLCARLLGGYLIVSIMKKKAVDVS